MALALLLWIAAQSVPKALVEPGSDDRLSSMLFCLGVTSFIFFAAANVCFCVRQPALSTFGDLPMAAQPVPSRTWLGLALILVCGLTYLSVSAISRHNAWLTFTSDLGVMDQTLWNTAHGRLLVHSVDKARPEFRPFSGRVELMYLPISLLYWIYSNPRTALFAQALFVALGAFPLFLLAREKLESNGAALVCCIAYFLHPAIQGVCLHSIHGNTLAIPFLLFAFYAMEKRNGRMFLVSGLLSLACREDVGFVLALMGLYAAWRWRGNASLTRRGLWVFVGCILYVAAALIVLPRFSHVSSGLAGETQQREMLGHLKTGMLGMLKTFALNPRLIVVELFTWENALYLFALLAPLGFLSLLTPSVLLTIVPALFLHLISGWVLMKNYQTQYPATFLPAILVAALMAMSEVIRRLRMSTRRMTVWLGVLLIGSGVFYQRTFALPAVTRGFWDAEHIRAMAGAVRQLPRDASVTVSQHLGPRVSRRERFYGEESPGRAEYVIRDLHEPFLWEPVLGDSVIYLMDPCQHLIFSDRGYGVIRYSDGVVTLRQGADHAQGLKTLFTLPATPRGATRFSSNGLELLDAQLIPRRAANGGFIEVALKWRAGTPREIVPEIRLICQGDNDAYSINHLPAFGHLPMTLWNSSHAVVDRFYLRVNRKELDSSYRLFVDGVTTDTKVGELSAIPTSAYHLGDVRLEQ
ncbi:MAG: DUF2079 domain-containing protein [Armatimonadetes bacterium]|nr:DUF2079 domain-containing protein [Armatimonadota bacterium]